MHFYNRAIRNIHYLRQNITVLWRHQHFYSISSNWNTGYIFLKLEGRAPASRSSGHLLEYHIGGYREPHNCIRHIALRFKKSLPVVEGGTAHVHLNADVAAVLSGKERIDFAQLSSVTDFHNATTIADNYATMWSVSTEK